MIGVKKRQAALKISREAVEPISVTDWAAKFAARSAWRANQSLRVRKSRLQSLDAYFTIFNYWLRHAAVLRDDAL